MSDLLSLPLLDHELEEDERAWMKSVYQDFEAVRASFSGRESEFNPKEALREVLSREAHMSADAHELDGPGSLAKRPQSPRPSGRRSVFAEGRVA